MMKLYAPFIREATLRVTMTLRSEGHGGDPSPKLQGGCQSPSLHDLVVVLDSSRYVHHGLHGAWFNNNVPHSFKFHGFKC